MRVLILKLIFGVIFLDQITKFFARAQLKGQGAYSFFFNGFRLEYSENTGAFLGFGNQFSEGTRFWIFTVLVAAVLLIVALNLFLKRDLNSYATVGFSLILGGGVGNLIDRLWLGHVTDFLNCGIGDLRTGIFNVADMAIVAGMTVLILESLLLKSKQKA